MAMQITPATSWIQGASGDAEGWTLETAPALATAVESPDEVAERSGWLAEAILWSPSWKNLPALRRE
jgi:hypothetical protein